MPIPSVRVKHFHHNCTRVVADPLALPSMRINMAKRSLTPITYETFHLLRPGRELDRIVAENVLRYEWSNRDNPIQTMLWHKKDDQLLHSFFKPSTDLNAAIRAITTFSKSDWRKWSVFQRITISFTHNRKRWKVWSSIVSDSQVQEICSFEGDDLPFEICRCLVMTYLEYGPQDYKTFGWLP